MKKICSGIIYGYTLVTAGLPIMQKPSATFIPERQNTWGFPILKENALKSVKQSAISDHLLQYNYAINFDDYSIFTTDSNKFKLLLRESLLTKRDKPILNRTIKLFPLELFYMDDSFISSIRFFFDIW